MSNDDALAEHSRDWIGARNWRGSPAAPRLGAIAVTATASGLPVLDARALAKRRVEVIAVKRTPEHEERYVEYVHNVGHPPHGPQFEEASR